LATDQSEYVQPFDPVRRHGGRFADLVRSLSRDEAAQRVPGMEWTAGEVAAHVVSVLRRYTGDERRAPSVAALRVQNAEDVAEDARDCDALADEVDERIAVIGAVAPDLEPSQRFPFHAGTEITTNGAWANLVAEFFVHGDDIARATDRSFVVGDADLEGVWRALLPAARGWLRSEAWGIAEQYEFQFSFGTVWVSISNSDVVVADHGAADYVIASTPASAATLAFYRRRLITEPTLALFVSRFHDI
jgi:uncharacterized protein (TIGR03083 family)